MKQAYIKPEVEYLTLVAEEPIATLKGLDDDFSFGGDMGTESNIFG